MSWLAKGHLVKTSTALVWDASILIQLNSQWQVREIATPLHMHVIWDLANNKACQKDMNVNGILTVIDTDNNILTFFLT